MSGAGPALAAVGLATAFAALHRRVLGIPQRSSWPPSADAVTAAAAEAATDAFRARSATGPHDAALEFAWSTAATLEPWVDGATFFPRIFADVEAARSSVHILMFGWREGEIGTRMAALLTHRLAEGVEVRVIVDGLGSRPYGRARAMFAGLAAAGAEIVVNDVLPPDRDGLFPDGQRIDRRQDELGRADHRKLYVVDGAVAWIGGAGVEDHFRDGRFHDVMVRVTGDVVRQAQAAFLTSFHGHGGPLPARLRPLFPEPGDPGSTPVALAQVIPGGFVAASQAIREQIDGARGRLDVMNPYLTDGDMLERILAAARRGVRVRIVTSQAFEQPAGGGRVTAPVWRDPLRRHRGVGGPGDGRPCQGRRSGRRRQLRHGQPRRLGALPQLGDHGAGPQRPARGVDGPAALRSGHRPRPARRGAPPSTTRERLEGRLCAKLAYYL